MRPMTVKDRVNREVGDFTVLLEEYTFGERGRALDDYVADFGLKKVIAFLNSYHSKNSKTYGKTLLKKDVDGIKKYAKILGTENGLYY